MVRPNIAWRALFATHACAACICVPLAAHSQATYASKNMRVIVPLPTGGPSDIVARLLGDKLAQALGKPVVVDHRTGAAQVIGTHIASKAEPDGYTLA